MAHRKDIVQYLNQRLDVFSFEDFSANGLQVQGSEEVTKVALVTDAAMATYVKASKAGCELIVAHHGIIWGGGLRSITGRDYEHVKFLLENDINLYAVHLPLDAHPDLGNNAELCKMVGVREIEPFGKYHGVTLGFSGTLPSPMGLNELQTLFKQSIGGEPLALPFGEKSISSVAIVSGGGSATLKEAVDRGFDCFITGEGKHEDHHAAAEARINVIYLGHYHSETAGVKALGPELEEKFGVECVFIDEPTIV